MLKKTITYTDFDGNERKEDFYFNLTEAELTMLEMSETGGFRKKMERLTQQQDAVEIMKTFEDLILRTYGEKSPDGKYFIKNDEIAQAFKQTNAYSQLFMELCTDADAAANFYMGVMPESIKTRLNEHPEYLQQAIEEANS